MEIVKMKEFKPYDLSTKEMVPFTLNPGVALLSGACTHLLLNDGHHIIVAERKLPCSEEGSVIQIIKESEHIYSAYHSNDSFFSLKNLYKYNSFSGHHKRGCSLDSVEPIIDQLQKIGCKEINPSCYQLNFSTYLKTHYVVLYVDKKNNPVNYLFEKIYESSRPISISGKDKQGNYIFRQGKFDIYFNEDVDIKRNFKTIEDFLKEDPLILPTIQKDEKENFLYGGVNSTAVIRNLNSMNTIPLEQLMTELKPGRSSESGFTGTQEDFINILATDNDLVLSSLGTNHQALAWPLLVIDYMSHQFIERGESYIWNGTRFKIKLYCFAGYQFCPLERESGGYVEQARASTYYNVQNLDNGEALGFSGLMGHLIYFYGFYEGKEVPNRVNPEQIIKVFGDNIIPSHIATPNNVIP